MVEFELRGHVEVALVEVALVEIATSNDYALTNGFWQPLATIDCNKDGNVLLFDYAAFAICHDWSQRPACGRVRVL